MKKKNGYLSVNDLTPTSISRPQLKKILEAMAGEIGIAIEEKQGITYTAKWFRKINEQIERL